MKQQITAQLFSLTITNPTKCLSPQGTTDINTAGKYSYASQPDGYFYYINTYGSHFISAVTLGAELEMDSLFALQSENDYNYFSFALGIGFHFGVGIDLEFGFFNYERKVTYSRQSISNLSIKGGIPDSNNFNGLMAPQTAADVAATKTKMDAWQSTMALNPYPTDWTTTRATTLFSSSQGSQGMDSAINCFYTPSCYKAFMQTTVPELA